MENMVRQTVKMEQPGIGIPWKGKNCIEKYFLRRTFIVNNATAGAYLIRNISDDWPEAVDEVLKLD